MCFLFPIILFRGKKIPYVLKTDDAFSSETSLHFLPLYMSKISESSNLKFFRFSETGRYIEMEKKYLKEEIL
jgi:hypothetical protein